MFCLNYILNEKFKIKKNVNKFLSAGHKIITEFHLRQTGFTYSASGPFSKHHERIQKFKETGNLNYIYRNESDKAYFAHNAAYSDK